MTKSIFIATTEPYSGKSIVALGLVNMLLGKTKKIGYFKPIINTEPAEGKDGHIETIIEYFNLGVKYEDTYAFTRPNMMRQMENGSQGEY
ncbi:MAG: AAA family ATPase [Segetibacter sp.]